ncbi:hypothetical protein [Streptomyces cyaneus]|uniref:SMP-30/gluconolactonase/LRE family protein n=1 Tax=Streptomyces cyaneus TaxID=1904 RepID=UPI00319E1863
MHVRTSLTTLAVAAALLAGPRLHRHRRDHPLSAPGIANHFDLAASQQPENITVGRAGSAYLTFSFARQVVRLVPGGRVHLLATLLAPAKASTPNLGKAFVGGIARSDDGTLYVTYPTGTADLTGIWAVRPGGRPHRIAALPADGLPNGLALDQRTGRLYVTDSVHGVIYRVPAGGGRATVWADNAALQPTTFAGANGIKLHNGAVWATNSDHGTVLRIPVTTRGTAGPVEVRAEGISLIDDFTFTGRATPSSPRATTTKSTWYAPTAPTPSSSPLTTASRRPRPSRSTATRCTSPAPPTSRTRTPTCSSRTSTADAAASTYLARAGAAPTEPAPARAERQESRPHTLLANEAQERTCPKPPRPAPPPRTTRPALQGRAAAPAVCPSSVFPHRDNAIIPRSADRQETSAEFANRVRQGTPSASHGQARELLRTVWLGAGSRSW